MANPAQTTCAVGVWTKVATAVMSAQVYFGGNTPGPAPRQWNVTYRQTGAAAPVNDVGVVAAMGDRDGAQTSYRAEHGEPVDIYLMPIGGPGIATVHAPFGDGPQVTQPEVVVNDVAIVAAPVGGINVPSDDGIVMDGYEDISFQLYLRGGIAAGPTNRTVTVIFQGSNDVTVSAARRWVTLASGYEDDIDDTAPSWQSIGNTVQEALVKFPKLGYKRIRVNYTFDGAPAAGNPGAVVINSRRS
jgi:hypothetical protein